MTKDGATLGQSMYTFDLQCELGLLAWTEGRAAQRKYTCGAPSAGDTKTENQTDNQHIKVHVLTTFRKSRVTMHHLINARWRL